MVHRYHCHSNCCKPVLRGGYCHDRRYYSHLPAEHSLDTPKKTRNTPQKTRNTSECVCKILRIPPRIEVRSRPLMKRQKPRKVIVILQSHKLENFTIFTISKIVTSASHSHMLIVLWAYLYERANEENGGGEGIRLPLSSSPLARLVHSVSSPAKSRCLLTKERLAVYILLQEPTSDIVLKITICEAD